MQIFPHGTKSILIRPRCTECDGFFSYIYMNQLKWISIKIPYMEHLGGKSSIYTHLEISENKISIGSTPQPLLTVTTGLLGFGNPLPRLHPGGATDPKKKQFPHLKRPFSTVSTLKQTPGYLGGTPTALTKSLAPISLVPKRLSEGHEFKTPRLNSKKSNLIKFGSKR